MKLDKMTFARLVAHCISNGMSAGEYELNELDNICDINVPVQSAAKANPADVIELLRAMTDPSSHIPAIKAYRVLTGEGLKDSKEAIERFRGMKLNVHELPVNFNKFEG